MSAKHRDVKFEPSRENHIYPLRIYDAQGNLKDTKSTEELIKESWDTFHLYDEPRIQNERIFLDDNKNTCQPA